MARRKTNAQVNDEGETVVALFQDQPSAEAAIQRLTGAGFPEHRIGVAVRDREQQEAITDGTGTQAAEGATTGALGGGVVGGVIGLLAGVGVLAIPGIGPIIASGALASTFAGAGIGAAAGGLLGALVGMGIPEEDAKHFEEGFRQGGVLVTVQAGSRVAEAREALSEGGADLGLSYGEHDAGTSRGAAGTEHLEPRQDEPLEAADQTLDDEAEVLIPLMEEQLEVRTRVAVRTERDFGGDTYLGRDRRQGRGAAYPGPERRLASAR